MAIIKCKMCGGDLEILEDSTVCECAYCGTRQTVPSADNEKKLTLFGRAGRLLRGCEFDKAAGVFETIIADFPQEAEAYWGLVLCKYGIEYVDDPASGKKIPTCHRSSFESVLDDPNFEQACENTDAIARRVYRDEARAIEALREKILAVSGREEPYDIFISYKETDDNGERTLDSVIAQDIYKAMTDEGYRVFFSRISLEDKLGTEYEPYIFAALNSAKVMLAVGTDYENYDSVWVKNEWSRFLKLIAKGEKKTLIPVFKNMDAYDMPKEFAKLAAQDMGKVGAMQDLLRGVEKILGKKKAEPAASAQIVHVASEADAKTAAAIKRGDLALEDGEFDKAKEFYDQALALDAECAEAYLGLALAEERCRTDADYIKKHTSAKPSRDEREIPEDQARICQAVETYMLPGFLSEGEIRDIFHYKHRGYASDVKALKNILQEETRRFEQNRNFSRAARFAKGETAERLQRLRQTIKDTLQKRIDGAAQQTRADQRRAAENYEAHLKAAEQKAAELHAEAEKNREEFYQESCLNQDAANSISSYRDCANRFKSLAEYKDSEERFKQCEAAIWEIDKAERIRREAEEKAAAEEAERKLIEKKNAKKALYRKIGKIAAIVGIAGVIVAAAALLTIRVIIPNRQYQTAEELFEAGEYDEAIAAFEALGSYKDSAEKKEAATAAKQYAYALELMEAGDYKKAVQVLENLGDYADSADLIKAADEGQKKKLYENALALMKDAEYSQASSIFEQITDYLDSADKLKECQNAISEEIYQIAIEKLQSGAYDEAYSQFIKIKEYKDVSDLLSENQYMLRAAYRTKFSNPGTIIMLGKFEQDNDTSNGAEAIEWIVLKRDGDKALLMSQYALDSIPFHNEPNWDLKMSWDKSSLRNWLNGTFYNSAFSAEEKQQILITDVKTEDSYKGISGGADTKDHVFLLSVSEAEEVLRENQAICELTPYALTHDNISQGTTSWWLRTMGEDTYKVAIVDSTGFVKKTGSVFYGNNNTDKPHGLGVRPVIWLNIGY